MKNTNINISKTTKNGLFTTPKKYFQKVPFNKIPTVMYRRSNNFNNYYYEFYKVFFFDEDKIKIEITDILDRNSKFLSLSDPMRKGNSYINIHIPASLHRQYDNHPYWSIQGFNEKEKHFFLKKRTLEEYNECLQRKLDIKKRD